MSCVDDQQTTSKIKVEPIDQDDVTGGSKDPVKQASANDNQNDSIDVGMLASLNFCLLTECVYN